MKKILLTCSALLVVVSIMAQNSAGLKLNLEKNKLYRLKSVSEQTVNQTVNGNQQTVDSRVEYTLSLKMIDETPEFMITEIHFDTLLTKTNSMGKTVNISSAVEGDIKSSEMADVMSCIMNRISKNALFVKMDFTGKPLEIVNAKILSGIVLNDTSSITLTGPMAAGVKSQIANLVSEESLKTMIGGFTWRLSGKEVSRGDEWNITVQTNSGGMMLDISTTYHLDEINNTYANITADSNIKAAANAVPISQGGATISYDNLTGLSKSDMVIDISTGLVIEDNAKTHIAGVLAISAPGFSMQMPMDINGESKVEMQK